MNELYKGYVPTRNKRCLRKFKDAPLMTLEEVRGFDEYAGILADDIVLIDIDDGDQAELLMDIVEDLQLNCIVRQTTRGKHFYFRNNGIEKCGTHKHLAVGLTGDIKIGSHNSYAIVKYNGEERFVEWDTAGNELEPVPRWLFPVKSEANLFDLQEGDGRNQTLYDYILTLTAAGFTKDESRQTLELINKYVFSVPLSDSELETIMRDDAFPKETFYEGKTFLFDKFATFITRNERIYRINGQLHIYDNGVYVPAYSAIEKAMIRHIPFLKYNQRTEVLRYIDLIAEEKQVADARYIAFRNGIYDLVENRMLPFDRENIVTNKIPYDYIEGSYSEIADRTLNKLSCGDESIRALLEECIGYCFYKRNELSKAFILTGEKANGKSTFLDMVKNLLGQDNVSALDLNDFDERFSIALMAGKLANIGDDISDEFMHGKSISSFKKIVSGNQIKAEFKGKDAFFFNPYIKLLFSANDIPRMKDKTGAVLRRLVIIPFNAKFSKEDPDYDPYIGYKLRSEECMRYLITLGIAGLKRIITNNGFTECAVVSQAVDEYETENNPVTLFIRETEINERFTKDVYREYQVFCIENGYTPMTMTGLTRELKRRLNLEIKKVRTGKKVSNMYILT